MTNGDMIREMTDEELCDIIHNDTRDVVEVFEDGFRVEFDEPDELVSNEKNV